MVDAGVMLRQVCVLVDNARDRMRATDRVSVRWIDISRARDTKVDRVSDNHMHCAGLTVIGQTDYTTLITD